MLQSFHTNAGAIRSHKIRPRKAPLVLAMHLAIKGIALAATSSMVMPLTAQAAIEQIAFNVPAGKLSSALNRFSEQAGLYLTGNGELTANLNSSGLNGSYSVREGLNLLLQGTGISYRFSDDRTVTLLRQSTSSAETTLPTLFVDTDVLAGSAANAYRVEAASIGSLGNVSLQNTPYSIEVYSRDQMDNMQARSLADITKTDASVGLSAGDLGAENNAFMIRGISPDFDTGQKLDGLNLRSRAKDLPLEHMEQVEILKGASGFLYGFGEPGGIISYRLKRPTDEPVRSVSTQLMDTGLLLVHTDLGGRFGSDDRFGYRINLVGEDGDSYLDNGSAERSSASIALDWRITPAVTWEFDALTAHSERTAAVGGIVPNASGMIGDFTIAEPLKPIDGSKALFPDWSYYGSRHEIVGTRVNWQINEDWDLDLAYRYSNNYRLLYSPYLFTNADGDYSAYVYNYVNKFESDQAQIKLAGKLQTGFIDHEVTLGTSLLETVSSNSRGIGSDGMYGPGNFSNPTMFDEIGSAVHRSDADATEYSRVKRRELFASDVAHLGDNLDLILGLRHGQLEDEYGDYDESATTPTLAAVYRPIDGLSLYASYVEAFVQGNTAPNTAANAGEVFEPMISEQRELGLKLDRERWSANLAVFQLNRGQGYTDSNNVYSQDGEALYEGLELSGKARLGSQWMLAASAMWLDPTNEKISDASLKGKHVQGVARKQFRLYGEYDVKNSPFVITGGAQYTGKRPLDANNDIHVGSVTLYDLGARYEGSVNDLPLTLRLNIDNLTDEDYWLTSAGSGYIAQGTPRTIKLGAQIDF
ncbi:TonB-dependent siderophore receptor [Marinobacterium mangrovicola]|uniref:Iron complex outermembrane receptor protein n=1 Tax=Marinobacterium mangrovicola TaxID=1476959 RepID=A0A4V2PD37_9GAMM|nr:TonB-dependent receptor [Marinobacterium mangrovicola]TCK03676.1 iron complex outermembrane receptor protein [Marinobacterium mangrovicola]